MTVIAYITKQRCNKCHCATMRSWYYDDGHVEQECTAERCSYLWISVPNFVSKRHLNLLYEQQKGASA